MCGRAGAVSTWSLWFVPCSEVHVVLEGVRMTPVDLSGCVVSPVSPLPFRCITLSCFYIISFIYVYLGRRCVFSVLSERAQELDLTLLQRNICLNHVAPQTPSSDHYGMHTALAVSTETFPVRRRCNHSHCRLPYCCHVN